MTVQSEIAKSVIEPRRVDFFTDSLGFRNHHNYDAESLVLIGDSFVVGNGSSQENLVSEILTKDYSIPTYNASIPSSPYQYLLIHLRLAREIGSKYKVVYFFFEGNDFSDCVKPKKEPAKEPFYSKIMYKIHSLESYRFLFSLTRKAIHLLSESKQAKALDYSLDYSLDYYTDSDRLVEFAQIGGKYVAFHSGYIKNTIRNESCNFSSNIEQNFANLREATALFVFIPSKFRVYYNLISEKTAHNVLPNKNWEYLEKLASEIDVPVLNLSPILIDSSKNLLEKDTYTFWRDDTHWNHEGMKIAAEAVYKKLQSIYGNELHSFLESPVSTLEHKALPPHVREAYGIEPCEYENYCVQNQEKK